MSDDEYKIVPIDTGIEERKRISNAVFRRDKDTVEKIVDTLGLVAITRDTTERAFNFAEKTGRGVVMQGAYLEVTITETTGIFRRITRDAEIKYQTPVIKLIEKTKGNDENVSYQ
jgi:hypothetical protein